MTAKTITYFTYFTKRDVEWSDKDQIESVDTIATLVKKYDMRPAGDVGWIFESVLEEGQMQAHFRRTMHDDVEEPFGFAWLSPLDLNETHPINGVNEIIEQARTALETR